MTSPIDSLGCEGYYIIRHAVTGETVEMLIREWQRLALLYPENAHGIRDLLQRSLLICKWASCEATSFLPSGYIPVRGILFDKIPGANWKVAWHQDLTIAVDKKLDLPEYGPWSVKENIVHVQPPLSILENIITLRLHLDETPETNGALRVIPRTHDRGKFSQEQIAHIKNTTSSTFCAANAGDILLMKPLLLHSSSPSSGFAHRRVIHIEYAQAHLLHSALRWRETLFL